MTEAELIARWESDKPAFQAWGSFVAQTICDGLEQSVPNVALDMFLKVPVKARVKGNKSLVDKAILKQYEDPYGGITDKVGIRFVVLLTSEIKQVEDVLCRATEWTFSKDRDFEDDRNRRPLEFSYQAVHYVVRAAHDIELNGVTVQQGTPCEVQIRTLLQHAHSELTHDNVYKPNKTAAPHVYRTVAKSMALIEAVDDYFESVVLAIEEASKVEREALRVLSALYRALIGSEPESAKSNLLILDAFADKLEGDLQGRLQAFLHKVGYVPGRIAERAQQQHLFRQPTAILTYFLAFNSPAETKARWPLTPNELQPVFGDLGLRFDRY